MSDTPYDRSSADAAGDACSPLDALRRAKAEFDRAQAMYHKLRQETAERLESVRRTSVGDVIDGTLDVVRRHPGAAVTVAALIGLYIGRLFRR